MSKFLTEDDKARIENHRNDIYYGDPIAADRIEQLAATCDQLERERDEAMMTGHDLAKIEYRDLVSDLEAKLAKAIQTLKWYADFGNHVPQTGQPAITFDMGGRAEDVLRELGEYDD